jgi:hypothetical protein
MADEAYKRGYDAIKWDPLPPLAKPLQPRRAASSLPCPMVIRDSIDEMQSMANGQWYDSKSALRRSYTADGNPEGRDYTEIGGAEIEPAGRAPIDKKGIRDSVEKALHDVQAGQVPDHIRAL